MANSKIYIKPSKRGTLRAALGTPKGQNTKMCKKCKKIFPNTIEFYYRRKTSPDGINTICKSCVKIAKPRIIKHWKNKDLFCLSCKSYKSVEEFFTDNTKLHRNKKGIWCKACINIYNDNKKNERRKNQTIQRMLSERYLGIKQRMGDNVNTLDFDKEYLYILWKKQNGKCAISNIDMTYEARVGRVSTNVSVDRVISSKGYLKNNVQLVCMAVNQMKNDLSEKELFQFCKSIVKYYGK